MKDINLRDIASKVQETLSLTDDQFGNLNHHARETYKELREENEQWGNLQLEWRALSAHLKESMYTKMEKKCESIFAGSTVPRETIKRGMEQRVHQVRRSWIDAQKLRSPQEPTPPATGQSSRTGYYDPIRDP